MATVIELDSNIMHAVMMTSKPPLLYWLSTSLTIMREVSRMRQNGIAAAYTLDAGSNVHVICTEEVLPKVHEIFLQIPGVSKVISSSSGKWGEPDPTENKLIFTFLHRLRFAGVIIH